jgi:DNA-binding Lrp family transcriptional regulator
MLKPQDVVILLKLLMTGGRQGTFLDLSKSLFISVAEVHKGVKRLVASRLVDNEGRPLKKAAEEYLIHGVKYSFPAARGAVTRGLPTGFGASPLKELISQEGILSPVWPDPAGSVRGYELKPIYSNAVKVSREDPAMYELLVLIDAVRDGSARERLLAEKALDERINGKVATAPNA